MALTVNLFYPKQKADLEKKLDPVKIGILIAVLIIGSLFLWYTVQNTRLDSLRDRKSSLERKWQSLEPTHETAKTQKAEDDKIIASAEALLQRVNERFYWAPLLSLFYNATPAEVQIDSLSGTYDADAGTLNLSVSGLAAGETPSFTAEDYRTALRDRLKEEYFDATVEFTQLGESSGTVTLDDQQLRTARFTMSIEITVDAPEEAEQPVTDTDN